MLKIDFSISEVIFFIEVLVIPGGDPEAIQVKIFH